jgi:hypothetical protein
LKGKQTKTTQISFFSKTHPFSQDEETKKTHNSVSIKEKIKKKEDKEYSSIQFKQSFLCTLSNGGERVADLYPFNILLSKKLRNTSRPFEDTTSNVGFTGISGTNSTHEQKRKCE